MKRSRIKTGAKSAERGSTFRNPRSELDRSGGPERRKGLDPGRRRTRSPVERALAVVWHQAGRVKNGGTCVRRGCGAPAGTFAHHLIEKEWLARQGLGEHKWDEANACPICDGCHDDHTARSRPITRTDLVAGGLWGPAVEWASALDTTHFTGCEPVLARLEATYPEIAA